MTLRINETLAIPKLDFWLKGAECFAGGVLTTVVSYKTFKSAIEFGIDPCPALPVSFYQASKKISQIRDYIPAFLGNLERDALIIPLIEGALFRYGLQELLLKQLPKKLFKKIPPHQLSRVNSKTAKISRVVLSATAFALYHMTQKENSLPNCPSGRFIYALVAGLFAGAIQESTGSPALGMVFHIGLNVPSAFKNEF